MECNIYIECLLPHPVAMTSPSMFMAFSSFFWYLNKICGKMDTARCLSKNICSAAVSFKFARWQTYKFILNGSYNRKFSTKESHTEQKASSEPAFFLFAIMGECRKPLYWLPETPFPVLAVFQITNENSSK